MKPLMSVKVERIDSGAAEVREWLPAEAQATFEGLNAFAERQKKRMQEAQQLRQVTAAKVRTIKAAKL